MCELDFHEVFKICWTRHNTTINNIQDILMYFVLCFITVTSLVHGVIDVPILLRVVSVEPG